MIQQFPYQINKKHDVIAEASDTMGRWHCNDERENVVDERVECFVHKCSPWKRRHRLQLVVNEQLWKHE